jgi:hypothetical protein
MVKSLVATGDVAVDVLVEVWAKPGLAQSAALTPNRAVASRGPQGLRRERGRFRKEGFGDSMCSSRRSYNMDSDAHGICHPMPNSSYAMKDLP